MRTPPTFRLTLACLAVSGSALAATPDLRLVPYPKEVRLGGEPFPIDRAPALQADPAVLDTARELLDAEFHAAGMPALASARAGVAGRLSLGNPASQPSLGNADRAEGYALSIESAGVQIVGADAAGLRHGVQTLCQLIRANRRDGLLPGVVIRDWPSLRWRACQDDITRGPSSTLAELKREIALAAGLKHNLFTYYMEHQYAFSKHPLIGPADGSLQPAELAAMVAYGRPLGVEILGNQQSFAHFAHILKHERYAALRENENILSPVNEDSYRLLDDLYSEVIPHLPFEFFNVCCDETQGLGQGPSKALAGQIGACGVYARHVRRVHDLLRERYGKRMMMWGDIILACPKELEQIPKDTIMLTWGYHAADSFAGQITPFAHSGYEFFVCPGVNNWSRILPDYRTANINIHNFVRDGVAQGALGMINTSWDDDGESLNGPNWYGFAWGAECAWNGSTTSLEDFNRRIGAVLFGETGEHFGQAIAQLSTLHSMPGMNGLFNARFWQLETGPLPTTVADTRAVAEGLLAVVRPAIRHLEACREEAATNRELLEATLFNARRVELIGQRIIERLDAGAQYEQAMSEPGAAAKLVLGARERMQGLAEAHRALGRQWRELWLRENRPYALEPVMARYAQAADSFGSIADRLQAAADGLAAGRPLPPPDEVGLSLTELGSRRTRPSRIAAEPLASETPWHVPGAEARFAIEIDTGDRERIDLPVEIAKPPALDAAGGPARAFVLGDHPCEVPAQIEADSIIVVLSGRHAAGRRLIVLVYPRQRVEPAAALGQAEAGRVLMENQAVRAVLGVEGGHLYAWQVKALGDLDVTMPGETQWFGFSDCGGPHRSSANKLELLAAGPAMVRCRCTDEAGLSKTISLYAGTSWVEVLLNTPLSYYWDFDDPRAFAADGPTPGTFLFSNGKAGPVPSEAAGVAGQVREHAVTWACKQRPDGLCLGLICPETPTTLVVGPGGGAGGVGLEGGAPAAHFVTWCGRLPEGAAADETMNPLRDSLDLRRPVGAQVHGIQRRETATSERAP